MQLGDEFKRIVGDMGSPTPGMARASLRKVCSMYIAATSKLVHVAPGGFLGGGLLHTNMKNLI